MDEGKYYINLQVRWGVEKEKEPFDAYVNNIHGNGGHLLIEKPVSLKTFLEGRLHHDQACQLQRQNDDSTFGLLSWN